MGKKLKIRNQAVRTVKGGPDYQEYMESEARFKGGNHAGQIESSSESSQANPDNLSDGAAYWAVDEVTKEVQGRVHKMLEIAKQVLTLQQYNAFLLVDIKKLKLREAARVMEINYQRVDQLIKRARLKLQKVYTERT